MEDILDESYEQSAVDLEAQADVEVEVEEAEVAVEAEEDGLATSLEVQLDTDDERTRRKLLESRPQSAAQAGPPRPWPRKRATPEADEDDDDVQFAESLDLGIAAPRRSSGIHPRSPVRRSLAPATPDPNRVPVRRTGTDGYTSSESAVPLPNTRASAEKKRRRVEEQYEPPAGTRAAEVSARKPAPKVPSPPVRQLRSRTIRR